MPIRGLTIIGDRINPGFRATRTLVETEDFEGLQSLAVRQAQAGASYLDVNAGVKALSSPDFVPELIRRIQAVSDLPVSLDCPDAGVLEAALKAYDPEKARGCKPLINSIAASRWGLREMLKVRPCKVVVMASERFQAGRVVPCKSGEQVHASARELIGALRSENPSMSNDDFFIDVSICTLAADTEGLIRMALDGIRLVHGDVSLKGAHIMGGLSNLPQHLPAKAVDGSDLKHQLECAFLTVAMPMGFDTVLGTPWRGYELLPEDNFVLRQFRRIIDLTGYDALTSVVELYEGVA
jgi:cobalamin-dependent methionine synthase I